MQSREDSEVISTRSCLPPLDGALEVLRGEVAWVLPLYVLAAGPFVAVMWLVIDVVTAQDRSALLLPCTLLVPATVWRWVGVAAIQRRLMMGLRGEAVALRRRVVSLIVVRLIAVCLLTWGGILLIPAFWGLFLSGFAGPALLEEDRRATAVVLRMFRWINRAGNAMLRAATVVSVGLLWGMLAVAAAQLVLVTTVFSSLMGLDTADLWLTMSGTAWLLTNGLVLFLAFDLYWAVASVLLLDHVRMRRTGSDLFLRMQKLEATP